MVLENTYALGLNTALIMCDSLFPVLCVSPSQNNIPILFRSVCNSLMKVIPAHIWY